jgi:hypothetical protein
MLENILSSGWKSTHLALGAVGVAVLLYFTNLYLNSRSRLDLPVAKLIPGNTSDSLMEARALVRIKSKRGFFSEEKKRLLISYVDSIPRLLSSSP